MTVRASFNTRRGNARFLPLGDVVGWQEVNDPPDRIKLAASLPAYTHYVPDVEWAAAIPISWRPDRFELVDKGRVKAHGGAAGITPARGCTWVLLRDVSTGVLVWHVNVHFISKIRLSNWRRLQWAMHLRTLQQLTDALLMHSPYGTVGGDFNNHNPVRIPGLVNLTPQWRGDQVWYDQLLVTEALTAGASVERGSNRLGSDHFPFMLTYQPPPVDPGEDILVPKLNRYGTDPNGRPIFMSDYLLGWWEGLVFNLGFRPTIVQGSWMSQAGGGADDSAGYHDFGGALDLRVWDLTRKQVEAVLWEARLMGGDAFERGPQFPGGMDPHIHIGVHTDVPTHPGIQSAHDDYLAGGNGLSGSSHARDPHPRPNPLVRTPPKGEFMPTLNEIRAAWQDDIAKLEAKVDAIPAEVWKVKGSTIKPDERTPTYGRMLEETHNRAKQARDAHDEPEPA